MSRPDAVGLTDLLRDVRACVVCAPFLAAGPRPVVQFSATASVLIIGQAPGARVHASGVPWSDPSGDRLRDWTGLGRETFYDPATVALMPMGLCYPGTGPSGDLPPRPECAPLWHARLLDHLPTGRLTVLVGSYALKYYARRQLGLAASAVGLAAFVRDSGRFGPDVIVLPHPSWRSGTWMRQNPWFEAESVPRLRDRIRAQLDARAPAS
jgi:uracil-DNA glycosylase